MRRNQKIEGIVVRNYRIQDYHKGTVIFTPQHGIIHAVAYGGYKGKSKLGASVQPLNRGVFDIYLDPVKNNSRIVEYEPEEVYGGIKESLQKYFTALLWLEIAVKSHGGGESGGEFYTLVCDALDILVKIPESMADRAMIQFLMRAVILLGGRFDPSVCGICAGPAGSGGKVYYNRQESVFVCGECASANDEEIPPAVVKYADYTLNSRLAHSINAGIAPGLLKYLKTLLYSIIQEYLEGSLTTLRTGRDYLA